MSLFTTLAADALVAILLTATIVTSVRLSRRISGLKADEAAMRKTIGDLVAASAAAERAIAGLRAVDPDAKPWYAMSKNGNRPFSFTMSEISFHCSTVGSTPVGLCAHACRSTTLRSGSPRSVSRNGSYASPMVWAS